jgi:hypothetical protein
LRVPRPTDWTRATSRSSGSSTIPSRRRPRRPRWSSALWC